MPGKDTSEHRLIIVGAGPKAVAIAAKRLVLKSLNYVVPKLIVIEKDEVAANWTGRVGFTDGSQHLGTPPHKDVGFPYDTEQWQGVENGVNGAMFNYSWHRYLVEIGEYGKWVDRGRPGPLHGEWARYLQWVAEQVNLTPEIAVVEGLSIIDGHWRARCRRMSSDTVTFDGEGVVITGPGSLSDSHKLNPPLVVDGATFWTDVKSFFQFKGTVAVVGAGETSAAIAVALAQSVHRSANIHIYTPRGAVYSRGESFVENWRYTFPGDWTSLSLKHRKEFIERTDRGVFSIHANSILDHAENIQPKVGRLVKWSAVGNGVLLDLEYDGHKWQTHADRLILPTGFDPFWFRSILEGQECTSLKSKLSDEHAKEEILKSMEHDLSISGVSPKLHAPMLAGLAQGPGFPNLSALGLLSDRILSAYVHRPTVSKPVAKPAWEQ